MNIFIQVSKAVAIAIYSIALIALLTQAMQPYRNIIVGVAAVLILAHLLEYLVLRKKLQAAAPHRRHHFLQTLLFGYGHWVPLLKTKRGQSTFSTRKAGPAD